LSPDDDLCLNSFPTRRSSDLLRNECPKALSAGSSASDPIRIFLQSFRISSGNLRTKDSSKSTVCIFHFQLDFSWFSFFQFFAQLDRKSTRLNSSHVSISYAIF